MLGQEVIFQADEDPYNSIKPVINEPADLERLSLPDFFTQRYDASGSSPL